MAAVTLVLAAASAGHVNAPKTYCPALNKVKNSLP